MTVKRIYVALAVAALAALLGCGYSGPNDPNDLEGKPCDRAGADKYTGTGGAHHFVCVTEDGKKVWREQA